MDERRREMKRRLQSKKKANRTSSNQAAWGYTTEREDDYYNFNSYDGEKHHPLFRKEFFLFKILAAVCLFLVVALVYKLPSEQLDTPRAYIDKAMNESIQFASISKWYETKFGKPIAFYPQKEVEQPPLDESYALPASGKITQTFEVNGEGLILETTKGAMVEAINGGKVIFVGKKPDIGQIVIIQHENGSESWYGQLETFDVALYDEVQKGQQIGKVTHSQDGEKGTFYLAIKQDGQFIDPKQVISFE